MSIEDAYNFRRVNDRLTTSGAVSRAQLCALRSEGYDTVINLLTESHDLAVAGEAHILQEQGVDYVYIPVDFDAPTRAHLESFSDAMDARVGQKIHVHCAANYRVSAFYSLYALRKGLVDEAAARRLVSDLWNPSEYPAWRKFIADERASDRF